MLAYIATSNFLNSTFHISTYIFHLHIIFIFPFNTLYGHDTSAALIYNGCEKLKGCVDGTLSAFMERPCCDDVSSLSLSLHHSSFLLPSTLKNSTSQGFRNGTLYPPSSSCDLLRFVLLRTRRSRLPRCYGSSILPRDVNRKQMQPQGWFSAMLIVFSF